MLQITGMAKAGRPPHIPLCPFGLRLRAAIPNAYPTRHAFMHAAGLHNSTLHKFETGVNAPRIDDVAKWAELLSVSPGWLAFGVDAEDAGPAEQASDVAWAAATVGLDDVGTKRLQRVRSICGPMSKTVLLAAAESIAGSAAHG